MRNLKRMASFLLAVVMMLSFWVVPSAAVDSNTPAYGGDKKGHVTVTVQDPSGKPVSNVKVQLADTRPSSRR